jgi:flagellar hook-associated protein 3 FlgL
MLRVTSEMMVTSSLRRLSARLESYESRQAQLATGRRVNKPSDDPSSASRALALRSSIRARTQEKRNADDAMTSLDTTDSELQNAVAQVQRAQTLVLRAASAVGSNERDAIAAELTQIRASLVSIANVETGGRPLFAGFSDDPPVQLIAGTWTYTGDTGEIQRRVTDQDRVTVNRTAEQAFGFDTAGEDLFTVLDDMIAAVDNDDPDLVRANLDRLEGGRARLTENLAIVGATANRVEGAQNRTENTILVLRGELSEVQDVDFEEAIMGLRVEEIAYEATLQALGRALPATLVSFMR